MTIVFSLICICFYYASNIAFPKPLKSDEEKILLDRYMNGDQEARNILIEKNLRLVAHIVKKYTTANRDIEDLISIGTIGLIKGINTYKVNKGTRLATYASRCIDNEILMTIRNEKKTNREISLQEPIGVDKEGNEISLINVLEGSEMDIMDQVDLSLKISELYQMIKTCLAKREKRVIELRYGLGSNCSKTQNEVAKILGISRSYVSRIEKKALQVLKESFTKRNYEG